ncbi:hypothetical protein P22_0102 [Propionispora sp. 2/2-37]|uniref:cell division protein FtsQ/DivIB n=1 Tax=Propionispora sp. 2/2-37 TaxID=1677858 RepID=UPI0006BB6D70|nr:FtsQ-type POTRA domain-containing protein [Propionispora sp. 2/2-37]CUH94040.1 hypothetical protein P22_0102 [Propionispora sp. 2/2-37]
MFKSNLPERTRPEQRLPPNLFFGLLLLFIFMLITFLLIHSSLFSIGSVTVEGNKYMSVEDVYRVANIPERLNIFRLDTMEIENRLKQDLRISEVEVTRHYPSTITISIKERQPVAYITGGYGFFELDKQGIIIAVYKNLKKVNVPLITGVKKDSGYIGDKVNDTAILQVLTYLTFLDEETLNQLSEVNIQSPEQMVAYTVNSVHIRLGNHERLEEKAKLTNRILNEVHDIKAIDYIDLTYASPFIRFRP